MVGFPAKYSRWFWGLCLGVFVFRVQEGSVTVTNTQTVKFYVSSTSALKTHGLGTASSRPSLHASCYYETGLVVRFMKCEICSCLGE